jgi:hypothetical protein
MSAAKKQTKQDLENKIAELEAKLNKLATQLEAKPTTAPKPAEVKPAEVKPTAPKPAEVKPAEVKAQPPLTIQAALENAYQNSKMSDFHWYRAHVTGYSPAPNRYFVRRTAPVGKVPTSNWSNQKAKVPGYTQPSNQYFATRARLAYHPADKMFGSFSGTSLTVDGSVAQAQTYQAPPPKPSKGTLPKGMEQTQVSSYTGKSRKEQLDDYEKDYLQRLTQQRTEEEQVYQKVVEAEAKSTRGTLPKGF